MVVSAMGILNRAVWQSVAGDPLQARGRCSWKLEDEHKSPRQNSVRGRGGHSTSEQQRH